MLLELTYFRWFLLTQTILVTFLFWINKSELYINNAIILTSIMYHLLVNEYI